MTTTRLATVHLRDSFGNRSRLRIDADSGGSLRLTLAGGSVPEALSNLGAVADELPDTVQDDSLAVVLELLRGPTCHREVTCVEQPAARLRR